MKWKELESDIELANVTEAFRHLDCLSVLCGVSNLAQGVRIYATHSCADAVRAHVHSEAKEVGGLLLGHVYQADVRGGKPGYSLTILTQCVPSVDNRNSAVSLEMGTKLWCQANDSISAGNIVIGWYHSHPNLGAFFSETDRRTQRAFFNHHYSLGWVIDPFRGEQQVFCGAESEEYRHPVLLLISR